VPDGGIRIRTILTADTTSVRAMQMLGAAKSQAEIQAASAYGTDKGLLHHMFALVERAPMQPNTSNTSVVEVNHHKQNTTRSSVAVRKHRQDVSFVFRSRMVVFYPPCEG
jgi:hypothetical protein